MWHSPQKTNAVPMAMCVVYNMTKRKKETYSIVKRKWKCCTKKYLWKEYKHTSTVQIINYSTWHSFTVLWFNFKTGSDLRQNKYSQQYLLNDINIIFPLSCIVNCSCDLNINKRNVVTEQKKKSHVSSIKALLHKSDIVSNFYPLLLTWRISVATDLLNLLLM